MELAFKGSAAAMVTLPVHYLASGFLPAFDVRAWARLTAAVLLAVAGNSVFTYALE